MVVGLDSLVQHRQIYCNLSLEPEVSQSNTGQAPVAETLILETKTYSRQVPDQNPQEVLPRKTRSASFWKVIRR